MQKVSDLLESSVLAVSTGKAVGIVEEAVISLEKSLLLGLVVNAGALFSKPRFIGFDAIFRIGFDAVMVRDALMEEFKPEKLEEEKGYLFKELQYKFIFSESGLQLGSMADVEFDCLSGELKGYVVSEGLLNDFINGRSSLPMPPAQIVCDDRVIVPESMAKLRQ